MLLTSLVLHFFNLKANPKKYVQGGFLEVVNPGQENTFSFILVWTLFYGSSPSLFGNRYGSLKDDATDVTRHCSWCVPFHLALRALTISLVQYTINWPKVTVWGSCDRYCMRTLSLCCTHRCNLLASTVYTPISSGASLVPMRKLIFQ
jgi:hypothetical protein